ncbi:hypothetical protein CDEST_11272 [Colletotrichum destructivum]|uniref:Uncharacterized protein n=1 Tax=Colletotrichum destructivum TaxID=34406 RepID=A0AAX4IT00_9PEZI|nr:hypothetical protein CDEST_11272 [Colletotrichum destructivum]
MGRAQMPHPATKIQSSALPQLDSFSNTILFSSNQEPPSSAVEASNPCRRRFSRYDNGFIADCSERTAPVACSYRIPLPPPPLFRM